MRGCLIIMVLALAGCGENQGWNPNYQYGATPYGKYKTTREAALMAGKESPQVIPIARPFKAPTAADIAGTNKPAPTGTPAAKPAQ